MKLRAKKIPVVCIMTGLLFLLAGSIAVAQMYPQPPIMVPYGPTMNMGVLYLNAGVKYRNIQTVRFEVKPHMVQQIVSLGTVPFGPDQEGTVFYPYNAGTGLPTGIPGTDPNTSGIWVYDDGTIDPRSPGINAGDTAFTAVGGGRTLGYHNVSQNNVGYFTVPVPPDQTDNGGGPYSETQAVIWSKRVDDSYAPYGSPSIIYQALFNHELEIEFTNKIWAPYFEAGYRASSFFNVMFGVSWFTIGEAYQSTFAGQGYLARRTFRDRFTFLSSDDAGWLGGGFSSAVDAAGGGSNPDPTDYYVILPAGSVGGRDMPTRTFTIETDPTVAPFAVTETLYNRLDFTAIEFKVGGSSWVPLWGMGQVGTSIGILWTPIPYTAVTRSLVVADETSVDAGVTAGDIIIDAAKKQEDVWLWPNIGMFVGGDLQLGWGRYFAKSSVEYDVYFGNSNRWGDIVENIVNLTGVNATFTAGAFF